MIFYAWALVMMNQTLALQALQVSMQAQQTAQAAQRRRDENDVAARVDLHRLAHVPDTDGTT